MTSAGGAESAGLVAHADAPATEVPALAFSKPAAAELARAMKDYAVALETASHAAAQAKQSDVVSASDVQFAARQLGVRQERGKIQRLRDIGILVLGLGLGELAIMLLTSAYTARDLIYFFTPMLVGASLYFYCWGRE